MGREQLEIILDVNALTDAGALQIVVDVMKKLGLPDEFEFDGKRVGRDEFLSQVERAKRWSFQIRSGGLAFRFGKVSAWGHCFVNIAEDEAGAAKNWDEWLAPFAQSAGFIQARVSDVDFDLWQNAEDPIQYEAVGRDFRALPMVSNGLPPPLTKEVIDISRNPGRRILRDGYVEAVGLRMWLGRLFRERAGNPSAEKLTAAGWTVTESHDGIAHLETAEFREGRSVTRQTELRSVLYG
jgi:hypothetical protein